MKKHNLLFAFLFLVGAYSGMAQVVIGEDQIQDTSAQLDIISDDKGLLIPRVKLTNTTDAAPVSDPAESLLVYNTDSINDVTPGFYYWNEKWMRLSTGEHAPVQSGPSAYVPPVGNDLKPLDTSIEINGGEGATFKEVMLRVAEEGITSDKLAVGAVTTDKIQDNAVSTDKIQDNAVSTVKIQDNAVSTDKIQEEAVTLNKIAPGTTNGQVLVTTINEGKAELVWQEPTVEEIKAAMPKFFFMPSVVIDLSEPGKNLYEEYVGQFKTPMASSVPGASIPVLGSDELVYHVTYYDETVFNNVNVSPQGMLTYDVISQETTEVSFMNIVFVVK